MTIGIPNGNTKGVYTFKATLTPSAVLTITAVEQDFTVTGVKVGDAISVSPPGVTAGAVIVGARVKAANTVSMQFVNPTVGSVTPLAGVHTFTVFRPEGQGTTVISD